MKKALFITLLLTNLVCWSQEKTPEQIVQEQVEAYNTRDIDAFMSFYSDDVKVYKFPNQLQSDGKAAMRESYTPFFKNAKVLNCKITKRIVTKNIVIDEEDIQYNDLKFGGVAIYEVENGKIAKVTFFE